MIIFDTDILTLHLVGNEMIERHVNQLEDGNEIAITIITRIEVLRGRFDFILKAADGAQLMEAMSRLIRSEAGLEAFPVLPITKDAATELDRLRKNRKLKKIGRADLLIACITLVHKATLITRNVRHFEQIQGLKVENWAD